MTFPSFSPFPVIFISSVLPCFPAFSHVSTLISSAYHDVSCIFAIFPTHLFSIYACFCCHFLSLPWHSYMFTMFSSVIRCVPPFPHVFALVSTAYHHISCGFNRILCNFFCFLFLFTSSVLHRFTLFSCIFPCFCSPFLCLPSHVLHVHTILYGFVCFTFLLISSVLQYFPAFSHALALISSAHRHISCIFTVFSTISITSSCSIQPPKSRT